MQKVFSKLNEIMLVGITVRTNNAQEQNWMSGKIFPCVQKYFQQQLANLIPNRKKAGTTLCVYTEYESDYTGDYTYFIGEEVSSIENIPDDLQKLIIPKQTYTKFTTEPGSMPTVLSDAWQKIWQMSPQDLGAERRYHSDFEVYDERATDHSNLVLDIYIGINS